MRQLLFILFAIGILAGCTKKISSSLPKEFKKYKRTTSGHFYKLHKDKKGKTIEAGETIIVNLIVRKKDGLGKDSIITGSIKDRGRPDEVIIPPNSTESGSPLFEGLELMSKGDSMTVAVSVDSMPQRPLGFSAGSFVYFDIAIHDVLSVEETKAKEQAKNEKLLKESKEAQAKAETVSNELQQRILAYNAGQLDDKIQTLDVDGHALKYIIHKQGTGAKAENNKTVDVHYVGQLTDGSEFDASFSRGSPISFPLGQSRVISGWDAGIALLNVGGSATLFIPYDLAYGEGGRPPQIPAKAELIFYVELMEVK